jgi:hypothetical protein
MAVREFHSADQKWRFYMNPATGQDYLVLWRYREALRIEGVIVDGAYGTHAGAMNRGDRMIVVATTKNELYLLGAIQVLRTGKQWAEGKNLSGAFRRIPLKGYKWRLRFEGTSSPKLSRSNPIAMQVRARRRLSPASAKLLMDLLATDIKRAEHEFRVSEGKLKQMMLSTRERDRRLRAHVLAAKGTKCEICGFDFVEMYGEFARNCVEFLHIEGLSNARERGVETSLDDVKVVCPNCHRALHQFRNPKDWKAFKRACHLG